jgi:hypothetical protein
VKAAFFAPYIFWKMGKNRFAQAVFPGVEKVVETVDNLL